MKWNISQSKKDHKKVDKKEYILWFVSEFMEFGCSIRTKKIKPSKLALLDSTKTYEQYIFNTKCNKLWNKLEKQWYKERKDHPWFKRIKIIPKHIRLTPLTLCVWHMDDGYCNPIDANIELNTQGFSKEEVEFLIERLQIDLGIQSHKKGDRGKFKIFVGRKSYFDFINMIQPYVKWNCFQHKLDTDTYNKNPQTGERHSLSKLTEKQVKQIFKFRDQGMLQREIAKKLEISSTNISLILGGKRWSYLGKTREYIKKPRVKSASKKEIIKLQQSGISQKKIAQKVGCNQSTVSRILQKH